MIQVKKDITAVNNCFSLEFEMITCLQVLFIVLQEMVETIRQIFVCANKIEQ